MINVTSYAGEVELSDVDLSLDLFNEEKSGELITVVIHTQRLHKITDNNIIIAGNIGRN